MSQEVASAGPGEGSILWRPDTTSGRPGTNIERYMAWLDETRGLHFESYADLWRWSVSEVEPFWSSIVDYFGIELQGDRSRVLTTHRMPGARWYPDARTNYAQHALRRRDEQAALVYVDEDGDRRSIQFRELGEQVARVAQGMRALGVGPGDRVAAYLPNVPEAVVAFLAAASVGAVWSLCSPDLGAKVVLDRFKQIEPKLLIGSSRYRYGGKSFDRSPVLAEICAGLPSLEAVVWLEDSAIRHDSLRVASWTELLQQPAELHFEPVAFEHPLWVVYTSGTTGLPKPIVHGHGGVLLEHAKLLALHMDLGPDDRFFWLTSTGWIMWNILVGGLLVESTVLLYDGNPSFPDADRLWQLAADEKASYFGVGAAYLHGCLKLGLEPGERYDLSSLRGIGSTGAPLSVAGFDWVYRHVKGDVPLGSVCGGTDVATGFIGGCPILPVRSGEIQCRCLGVKAEAYDASARPLVDAVGELVIEAPMPSMPIYFWNDRDGSRYRGAYFERFDERWTHGDWVQFKERGSCVVYGRSDATLNRGGIRLGTRDFYDVVESLPEVADSLVIDTSELGREGRLVLFVAMAEGYRLDAALEGRLNDLLRDRLSPRHRPDTIVELSAIPRTLTGKKLEVPVKRILAGDSVDGVVSRSAVENSQVLDEIAGRAPEIAGARTAG